MRKRSVVHLFSLILAIKTLYLPKRKLFIANKLKLLVTVNLKYAGFLKIKNEEPRKYLKKRGRIKISKTDVCLMSNARLLKSAFSKCIQSTSLAQIDLLTEL